MNGYPAEMISSLTEASRMMSVDQHAMVTLLKTECQKCGSQKAFAKQHGYSPAFINDVLHGRREVSENLARILGYQRIVSFRNIKQVNNIMRSNLSPCVTASAEKAGLLEDRTM